MFVAIYLLAVGLLLYYIFYVCFRSRLTYVVSGVDQQAYLVRNREDKSLAADMIARTKIKLLRLCTLLQKNYPTNRKVRLLVRRFDPSRLSESEENGQHTSYSLNKGERIVLCLRSKDTEQKLADDNTILFVALHELAHVMTISVGHTREFWENFKFLLANAIFWKLYAPQDFKGNPQAYCGTQITDTPLRLTDMPKYVQFEAAEQETNEAAIRTTAH